jgi:hypothetical protein
MFWAEANPEEKKPPGKKETRQPKICACRTPQPAATLVMNWPIRSNADFLYGITVLEKPSSISC